MINQQPYIAWCYNPHVLVVDQLGVVNATSEPSVVVGRSLVAALPRL